MFCENHNDEREAFTSNESVYETDYLIMSDKLVDSVSINGSCEDTLPLGQSALEHGLNPKNDSISKDVYYCGRTSKRSLSTSSSNQSYSDGILEKFFAGEEEIDQYIAAKRRKRESNKSKLKYKTDINADLHCKNEEKSNYPLLSSSQSSFDISTITKKDCDLISKRQDMLSLLELDEIYRTVKEPSIKTVSFSKQSKQICSHTDTSHDSYKIADEHIHTFKEYSTCFKSNNYTLNANVNIINKKLINDSDSKKNWSCNQSISISHHSQINSTADTNSLSLPTVSDTNVNFFSPLKIGSNDDASLNKTSEHNSSCHSETKSSQKFVTTESSDYVTNKTFSVENGNAQCSDTNLKSEQILTTNASEINCNNYSFEVYCENSKISHLDDVSKGTDVTNSKLISPLSKTPPLNNASAIDLRLSTDNNHKPSLLNKISNSTIATLNENNFSYMKCNSSDKTENKILDSTSDLQSLNKTQVFLTLNDHLQSINEVKSNFIKISDNNSKTSEFHIVNKSSCVRSSTPDTYLSTYNCSEENEIDEKYTNNIVTPISVIQTSTSCLASSNNNSDETNTASLFTSNEHLEFKNGDSEEKSFQINLNLILKVPLKEKANHQNELDFNKTIKEIDNGCVAFQSLDITSDNILDKPCVQNEIKNVKVTKNEVYDSSSDICTIASPKLSKSNILENCFQIENQIKEKSFIAAEDNEENLIFTNTISINETTSYSSNNTLVILPKISENDDVCSNISQSNFNSIEEFEMKPCVSSSLDAEVKNIPTISSDKKKSNNYNSAITNHTVTNSLSNEKMTVACNTSENIDICSKSLQNNLIIPEVCGVRTNLLSNSKKSKAVKTLKPKLSFNGKINNKSIKDSATTNNSTINVTLDNLSGNEIGPISLEISKNISTGSSASPKNLSPQDRSQLLTDLSSQCKLGKAMKTIQTNSYQKLNTENKTLIGDFQNYSQDSPMKTNDPIFKLKNNYNLDCEINRKTQKAKKAFSRNLVNISKGRKSFSSCMFTLDDFISNPLIEKKIKVEKQDTFDYPFVSQKRKSSPMPQNDFVISSLKYDIKEPKIVKHDFKHSDEENVSQVSLDFAEKVNAAIEECLKGPEIENIAEKNQDLQEINSEQLSSEFLVENLLLECGIKNKSKNILSEESSKISTEDSGISNKVMQTNAEENSSQNLLLENNCAVNIDKSVLSVENVDNDIETDILEQILNDTELLENTIQEMGMDNEDIDKNKVNEDADMNEMNEHNNLSFSNQTAEFHYSENNRNISNKTNISDLIDPSEMESTPTMRAAMKTFIKPFTSAKKSVPGEKPPNSNNKTALKTFANKHLNRRLYDASPNDIIKDGSAIFILKNSSANGSSCEEISDDDTKAIAENWSLQELIHPKGFCVCTNEGLPCLFNGEPLQQTCEGEDTMDGNNMSCLRKISKPSLLSPSTKIKYRMFCDIHFWRLKHHHCCPKCGIFCTQGTFLMCQCEHQDKNNNEFHLFHLDCYLIPSAGLPPGCPHCCRFSKFEKVQLVLKNNPEELPQNDCSAQNLTSLFKDYSLLLKVENENESSAGGADASEKKELKSMLMALSSEKCLKLRPTGKCLYNPIKIGDVKKVSQLLVNGVNPNHKFKTHKNNTPLHIAAYFGFIGIVDILIQYGGMIDAVNEDLETPLILAVERKHLAVVRYLIFAGAQVGAMTENGVTSFHVACKSGCKEIAQFLFDVGNFDVNIQDDGGWTPLVWACEYKYSNLVVWLLELGADPNIRDSEENIASHWAACSGEHEILDILLDNGCSLSFVNKRGDTALHIAARKDHYLCVRLLLKKGALTDLKNEDGETPLMCCDEGSKSYRYLKKYQSLISKKRTHIPAEHVVFSDISSGLEEYAIQVINEIDEEKFNPDFRYIVKNCQTVNIQIITTVDSMIWCECRNGCGTSSCACTKSAKCWYDTNNCLVSDFDMIDPPTIYECHKLCHCPQTCVNRVVQKGLRSPLQLFRTQNRGWGVRCLKKLPKGAFVCEYIGEIISGEEVLKRNDDTYIFDLSSKEGDYCLDGRFYGNVARFINHSCEPNLIAVAVFMQHQDLNFPHIALFTSKEVAAYEELCFDYGTEFWLAKSQSILCTCGSQFCKYSKDSIDDTLYTVLSTKLTENSTEEIIETGENSLNHPIHNTSTNEKKKEHSSVISMTNNCEMTKLSDFKEDKPD